MVRTWAADVSALMHEQSYQKFYQQVPPFRQEKADRLKNNSDKALSIGAWTLYERMKTKYNLNEEAVYNLSHSGHYVLCSICAEAGSQVGCDLEMVGKLREGVAHRFFTPSEFDYIMSQPTDDEQRQAFYRLWVLKESFLKATRRGMGLGLDTFEIKFDEHSTPTLNFQPKEIVRQYYLKEYDIAGVAAKIAVCSDSPDFAEQITYLHSL